MSVNEIDIMNTSIDSVTAPSDAAAKVAFDAEVAAIKRSIRPIISRRAAQKGFITRTLNKFKDDDLPAFVSQELNDLNIRIQNIETLDTELNAVYENSDQFSFLKAVYDGELNNQAEYHYNLKKIIFSVKTKYKLVDASNSVNSGNNSNSNSNFRQQFDSLEPYRMKIPVFSGSTTDEILDFSNWLRTFTDIILSNNRYSDCTKLLYLKASLKAPAIDLVKTLSSSPENLNKALDILKNEFQNKNLIIERHIQRIVQASTPVYNDTVQTKQFLSNLRQTIQEFETLDLKVEKDGIADKIITHLSLQKVSKTFKNRLSLVCGSLFVSVFDILEQYPEIIQTIEVMNPHTQTSTSKFNQNQTSNSKNSEKSFKKKSEFHSKDSEFSKVYPHSTLQSFNTQSTSNSYGSGKGKSNSKNTNSHRFQPKLCKFCNDQVSLHALTKCEKYKTGAERRARLRELGLCEFCSAKHPNNSRCPGLDNKLGFGCMVCNSKMHISAVHIDEQSNHHVQLVMTNKSSQKNVLLPSITVDISCGDTILKNVRCQLDNGSMSNFCSADLRQKLSKDSLPQKSFNLKTFTGMKVKNYESLHCTIKLGEKSFNTELLSDDSFNIDFKTNGLSDLISNLSSSNYKFADEYFNNKNTDLNDVSDFKILLGSGFLGNLHPLKSVNVSPINDSPVVFYEFDQKLILFGDLNEINSTLKLQKKIVHNNPVSSHDDNLVKNSSSFQIFSSNSKQELSLSKNTDLNLSKNQEININSAIDHILNPKQEHFNPMVFSYDEIEMNTNFEKLFSTEQIGIKENSDIAKPDEKYQKRFLDSITYDEKEQKYLVELPFNDAINNVESNHQVAFALMHKVHKDLSNNGLLEDYDTIFKDQIKQNIIERIEVDPKDYDKYCFIPHFGVKRLDNPTTRVRIVYNASFTRKNSGKNSLNFACWEGSKDAQVSSMFQIIQRWRTGLYVCQADVEKAFLQIFLKSEDQKNKFCLFWKENGKVVVYRSNTIIFGHVFSPSVLYQVIKYHVKRYPESPATLALSNSMYSDNLVHSCSNEETLRSIYKDSVEIMGQGHFNLRGWVTNNKTLQDEMIKDGRAAKNTESQKVLGYNYVVANDSIKLTDFDLSKDTSPSTKRKVCSIVGSCFDLIGLYLPITVTGRILLQSIWKEKSIGWDSNLNEELEKIWLKHKANLNLLKTVEIPRFTADLESNQDYELIAFCDASKEAYAFCCYLVSNTTSNLIFAKSKMCGVFRSIPISELLSQVLFLSTLESILETYPKGIIKTIRIFHDSQIALSWSIEPHGCRTRQTYTKNRIKELVKLRDDIQTKYDVSFFYHFCESELMIADKATKINLNFKSFTDILDKWLKGPFDLTDKSSWPNNYDLKCLSKNAQDVIRNQIPVTKTMVFHTQNNVEAVNDSLIDLNRFSKLTRLHNAVFYVLKFISKSRKKNESDHNLMNKARQLCIKSMQKVEFEKEFDFLNQEVKDESACPPLVKSLNLFIDENGFLRSKGRISKLNVYSYDVHNPIILSKKSNLTRLMVENEHKLAHHLGIQVTLSRIREAGYWIPQGRQTVKSIIRNCFLCTKLNLPAYAFPKWSGLPKYRLKLIACYKQTACDYAGPMLVVQSNGEIKKMWLAIYTDMIIRSCHIDLIEDCSVKSFLNSFSRFCNLYRIPDLFYTDNAKNFTASRNYLTEAVVSDEFKEFLLTKNIKHYFIPPRSPFYGGVHEVMVRSVKSCLYKALGKSKMNRDDLLTILMSCQNAINSRPLTYVYSERSDSFPSPLTPNCFLKMFNSPGLIIKAPEEDDLWQPDAEVSREELNKSFEAQTKLFETFKRMFYSEYTLSLREHTKNLYSSSWENKICLGDVVLIDSKDKPRIFWQMGIVKEIQPSSDGKIRSVRLKLPHNKETVRTIDKLYPLEIQICQNGSSDSKNPSTTRPASTEEAPKSDINESTSKSDSNSNSTRPKRAAALKTQKIMRKQIADGYV